MAEAINIADRINSKSPYSSKVIIELVNKGIHLNMKDALSLESEYFEKIFKHQNKNIGISACIEKKPPICED